MLSSPLAAVAAAALALLPASPVCPGCAQVCQKPGLARAADAGQ